MTIRSRTTRLAVVVAVAAAMWLPGRSLAQPSDADLAKAAQNPVAALISVPFQFNMNYDTGPEDDLQTVLNIQPVIPFELSKDWNLITRTIVPVVSQPDLGVYSDRKNGLGDVQFSAFLSPKAPTSRGWIWGAGPVVQLDTASSDRLGQGVWGLGPSVVALRSSGPWVYGALVNNIWSVSEGHDRSSVNQFLLQPFINYNFPSSPGRYLTFAPIMTANWKAKSGQRWLIPLGIGIGQVTRFGQQPVNLQVSYYQNVEKPKYAPNYQIRLQIQFMFPK